MKVSIKNRTRFISLVTIILMIFSLFVPGVTTAQTDRFHTSANEPSNLTENKVSDRLINQFEQEDMVTFLVKFKEKADPMAAADEAIFKSDEENLSAYKQKSLQRSAVISELKATALESQKNVNNYLGEEVEKGNAASIKNFYIVNGLAVTATKEVAEKIASFSEVEKILPNEERQLFTAQSPIQASEKTFTNEPGWNVDRIEAPAVWDMGVDGSGVVVATIDSGAQWDHFALKEKYRGFDPATGEVNHEYSFFDPRDGETEAYDDNGHGTHVTGTLVGSEPDGSNAVGIAPGAEWISVKAFNSVGMTEDALLLDAAQWLLAPGGDVNMAPDIINNSWGGGPGLNEWYRDTVIAWRAAGIIPVFAAGNVDFSNPGGPESIATPANYPESFAVGNTERNDQLAESSLRGPSPYDEIKPDVSAPGTDIRSSNPGNEYGTNTGTSMAAPAVSGIAALLLSVNASLTIDEMEGIIMDTATAMSDEEYPESPNNGYGHGIVNAYEAVNAISSGMGVIEGQVLGEGEDTEFPSYEHEPPELAYQGLDLDLMIRAMDDVSVTSVELFYKDTEGDWQTLEASRYEGGFKDGEFKVNVPGNAIEEGILTYYWVVTDFGENRVTSKTYTVDVKSGITTGYFEDFETEPFGWTSFGDNNSWEWGVPTSGPEGAYSGEKLYATNLDGPYDHNMDATLVMPPIELPDEDAYLQFKTWHDFQDHGGTGEPVDYGHVVVSTDMEEWTQLEMIASTSAGWEDIEVDLSEYSGESIYVGFNAYSSPSIFRDGWYIDDVQLSKETLAEKDDEPPTYEHDPPVQAFEDMDQFLEVFAEDNLGIASVTLEYKNSDGEWESVTAEMDTGSVKAGQYIVWVPHDITAENTLEYQWRIVDYGGNEITGEVYEVDVKAGITTGYFENFEEGADGWFSFGDNDPWEWGSPTSGPEEAVSGENVYATNLSGDYNHEMFATLVMPAIDVPEGDSYLQFKSWHYFETNSLGIVRDYGQLVISTDLEEWSELEEFTGQDEEWRDIEIDLSDYSGERIYLGFHVYSNTLNAFPGWYIDDIALSSTSMESPVASLTKVKTSESIDNLEREKHKSNQTGLPLGANVSIVETGISTVTDRVDGSYSLRHDEGEFTVKAEKYGYYPEEQEVMIIENEPVEANFILEEMPRFNLDGVIKSENTGNPIADATLFLVEDANVKPVETDQDGNFSLTAYEGTYTVKIIANDYHSKEVEIALDENKELEIELDPFFTYPGGEIGYDDGTAENARAFFDAGNKWAVKMSLEEGEDAAVVTDGVFQFHGTDFPAPGGTSFKVEVWSSGDDGLPDERLAGPIEAEAIRDLNEWTVVDLREQNIVVEGDFFMVYVQDRTHPYAPGLATDENGPNAQRSYQYVDGNWDQTAISEGNYMIRARVAYEVEAPSLNDQLDGTVTNEAEVTLEGTASPMTTTVIYNNDHEIARIDMDEDRSFTLNTELEEGINDFKAVTKLRGEEVEESQTVTVTLDTILPELNIENPTEGKRTNRETVIVEGTAIDENLDKVTVNGLDASIEDGMFSERIILNEGENVVEVVATDLAGHSTTETITVYADYTAPDIVNLTPDEDQELATGQTVTVEFESEPGLDASFVVHMPLTDFGLQTANATELPMVEAEEGIYTGYWTIPRNAYANGAVIEVIGRDDFGNEMRETAEGRLFINIQK